MQLKIPSKPRQILCVTNFELLKFVRGKKIHVMLGMAIAIPILLVALPEFFDAVAPEKNELYLSALLGPLFFIQVITVAFFGSGMLVSETHDKTGFSLFPNPIDKTSIWLGKFIATEIASILTISFYYLVISFASLYKYDDLPFEILSSFFLSVLVMTTLVSITFLASSTLRSPTSVLVIIILIFIVIFPMVDQIIPLAEIKPWFTPSFSSGIIHNILKVPYPIDLQEGDLPKGPFDSERFVPYLSESILVLLTYSISSIILSVLIFKKMEMK